MLAQAHRVLRAPSWEGRTGVGPLPAAFGFLLGSPVHALSTLQSGTVVNSENSAGFDACLLFLICQLCPSHLGFHSWGRQGSLPCGTGPGQLAFGAHSSLPALPPAFCICAPNARLACSQRPCDPAFLLPLLTKIYSSRDSCLSPLLGLMKIHSDQGATSDSGFMY